MSNIDIRHHVTNVSSITFSDGEGGLGQCIKLEKNLPVQFNLVTKGGDKVHVKHKDIDALIEALKFAKEKWSN